VQGVLTALDPSGGGQIEAWARGLHSAGLPEAKPHTKAVENALEELVEARQFVILEERVSLPN
jgi:hypothetical protein